MKTLLLIISLTYFKAMAIGQIYYGGSAGVGIGKYYNTKTKQIKTGPNDLYLSIPVGYATTKSFLFEVQPQITLSTNINVSALAGYKIDFSDNAGIHLLVGYADDLLFTTKPFSLTQYFHKTATIRIWNGQAMIQGTYFNKQLFVGIGVIGFWESIY